MFLIPILALATFLSASAAVAASTSTTLPDTPVGKLGGEPISHLNADTPGQIQMWAPTVLSSAFAEDDKADFLKSLASAARDSGGVDLFDVRTDRRRPGLLEVAVKGRRIGPLALFVLAADPAQPSRLGQAELFPMDIYASWPKGAVSHAEMRHLIHTTFERLVRTSDFSGCVTVLDSAGTVAAQRYGDRVCGIPMTWAEVGLHEHPENAGRMMSR